MAGRGWRKKVYQTGKKGKHTEYYIAVKMNTLEIHISTHKSRKYNIRHGKQMVDKYIPCIIYLKFKGM